MKTFLRYICRAMEMTCALKDRFGLDEWEVRLTGDYCYLARWAMQIDEKYNLKTWPNTLKPMRWKDFTYQKYIELCGG